MDYRSETDALRAQNEQLTQELEGFKKWQEEVNRKLSFLPPDSCNMGPNPYNRDPFDDDGSGGASNPNFISGI